jgi:DNA-directed RNA polymerase subunit M/transcription elongation factor TFIIS
MKNQTVPQELLDMTFRMFATRDDPKVTQLAEDVWGATNCNQHMFKRVLMKIVLATKNKPWDKNIIDQIVVKETEFVENVKKLATETCVATDVVKAVVGETKGQYECSNCKAAGRDSWDTSLKIGRTRGADEPETVFVDCGTCAKHWSISD